MKDGKFIKAGVIRLRALCGVVWLFVVLPSIFGCRSSRAAVEETYGEISTSVRETVEVDTVGYSASTGEEYTDSAEIRTEETADITIIRDSVGRIVGITAVRHSAVKANERRKTAVDVIFHGLDASLHSEIADTVSAFTKAKEEKKDDYHTRTPIEMYIATCLIALVILMYFAAYIYMVWRQRGK